MAPFLGSGGTRRPPGAPLGTPWGAFGPHLCPRTLPTLILGSFWEPLGSPIGSLLGPIFASRLILEPPRGDWGEFLDPILPPLGFDVDLGPKIYPKIVIFWRCRCGSSVVNSVFLLDFGVFYRNPEKTPFLTPIWSPFGGQVGLIWAPGGSLSLPMGPQRALWGRFFGHLFFMSFFTGFWVPPRVPNRGSGGMVAYFWGQQKTPFSDQKG